MSNELITDIQFTPCRPRNGHVGFVSFVLNKYLYCCSIGVHTRPQGGIRLVYPQLKYEGQPIPTFHPIEKDFAKQIEIKVENHVSKFINELSENYEQNI